MDVRRTADDELVVFHDPDFQRVMGQSGSVETSTLDELHKLDVGHTYTPDGGKTYPLRGKGIKGILISSVVVHTLSRSYIVNRVVRHLTMSFVLSAVSFPLISQFLPAMNSCTNLCQTTLSILR
jgi:glycerophosphoryl diester phosphodiesterase